MFKILGGVVIGVFVGAVAVEVLQRKRPGLIQSIEGRAERAVQGFFDAFHDGFRKRPVPPSER